MINQQEELQVIFLKWFKHHGVRSMSQIRQSITNLCNSYAFEDNGLYGIFFPFVRMGFIEFIGDDAYQIAPSIVVHDQKAQVSTAINLDAEQIDLLTKQIEKFEIDPFGVIRFSSTLKSTQFICDQINCPFSNSNIDHILSYFPKLSDVISKFDLSYSHSLDYFQKLPDHSWQSNSEKITSGIFRKDLKSRVFYYSDGANVYCIPDSIINPDGRYIAEAHHAVKLEIEYFAYNHEENELTVKSINIPILIDRILRIPSYHLPEGTVNLKYESIYKNISPSNIKQLNRIFETKIKTIHE